MVEAQADIGLGEAIEPASLAHSKVYRGDARMVISPVLGFLGVVVAASLISTFLPLISLRLQGLDTILWTAGGVLGIIVALRILYRQRIRDFLGGLKRMGSPETFPTRFRFTEQQIQIDNDRVSYRIAWPSVLFMMPGKEHWLMQVDTTTFAVPYRAFSGDAEQQFLAIASNALSGAARRRSVLARQ